MQNKKHIERASEIFSYSIEYFNANFLERLILFFSIGIIVPKGQLDWLYEMIQDSNDFPNTYTSIGEVFELAIRFRFEKLKEDILIFFRNLKKRPRAFYNSIVIASGINNIYTISTRKLYDEGFSEEIVNMMLEIARMSPTDNHAISNKKKRILINELREFGPVNLTTTFCILAISLSQYILFKPFSIRRTPPLDSHGQR